MAAQSSFPPPLEDASDSSSDGSDSESEDSDDDFDASAHIGVS